MTRKTIKQGTAGTGISYAYIHGHEDTPVRIQFANGNETRYVYSAAGEKLRVVYYVASPNITRTFGVKPDEPSPGQVLFAGQTEYLLGGNLIMKDGMIDRLLFEGGYAKATPVSSTTYGFTPFFYNQDHLGNNREVVSVSGAVQQVTNYYPFGAPYADPSAVWAANLQPYKYNGKELDKMHGLNTYDYGARQYDPILGRWDRMDPLCEKYYGVSPYAYCGNNPVNTVDPDGRIVKPSTFEAMKMIHNTLPKECLSYVKFDSNGYVDKDLINSYDNDDLNFNNLKTLVNDPLLVNVCVDNTFCWKQGLQDADGRSNPDFMRVFEFDPLLDDNPDPLNNIEDVSSGQTGFTGKTLFPDLSGAQCSPDNSVYVIVNKDLTESARADAFCHEGFGHALLYVKSGYDRNRSIHNSEGNEEKNIELKEMILDSRRCKFNNY